MRIGELAQAAGMNPTALRFYERRGLLAPTSRSGNGYRDYDPAEVQRLGFIRSAQTVGMSLAEIRTILQVRDAGEAPCDHVLGLVNQHRAATAARIRELQAVGAELDRLAEEAAVLDPTRCPPGEICHLIPRD